MIVVDGYIKFTGHNVDEIHDWVEDSDAWRYEIDERRSDDDRLTLILCDSHYNIVDSVTVTVGEYLVANDDHLGVCTETEIDEIDKEW